VFDMAGKSPVTASDEQRLALVALAGSRDRGEADQAQAVLLTLAGWTNPKIAEAFAVREDTVRLWRSDFAKGGVEALKASVAPGPDSMKSETALRVVTPLLEQPVADRPNRTIPRLRADIEAREGVRISHSQLYSDSRRSQKNPLAKRRDSDSTGGMIRGGFLDSASRKDLAELARDGSAAHRLARRANALVLLDDGMSCEAIAKVLLLDDDTIRTRYRLYQEDGIDGLTSFDYEGGARRLSEEQQDKLKAWITETLPRTTREFGAWVEKECSIEYQGRSGLVALLHRLGMEHRKPKTVSRKLDPERQ
jgi:transposase